MLEALSDVAQKMQNGRVRSISRSRFYTMPYREDIHCMIMARHAALGNRVAVKEQYENLRRLLRKEPWRRASSRDTKDLFES